jgi:hypothetical protein
VIQNSGWRGPIGLIAEQGGDAEANAWQLSAWLAWIAAELKRPAPAVSARSSPNP